MVALDARALPGRWRAGAGSARSLLACLLAGAVEGLPGEPAASLDDAIAGFVDLDVKGLCLQWRNHLGGLPPAHLPRWLLLRILAYRVQVGALGGPDKETLLILRQPKGHTLESPDGRPFEARIAIVTSRSAVGSGA